jgi:hypothetical protein
MITWSEDIARILVTNGAGVLNVKLDTAVKLRGSGVTGPAYWAIALVAAGRGGPGISSGCQMGKGGKMG